MVIVRNQFLPCNRGPVYLKMEVYMEIWVIFQTLKRLAREVNYLIIQFLTPDWGVNDQHPGQGCVAGGEQWIYETYQAVKSQPTKNWNRTLLIITYDEHGGCYDHVPPPGKWNNRPAQKPCFSTNKSNFNFDRFGVRIPTVLVSPLIQQGTVFRTQSKTPFDHTSILSTLEKRFNLPPLTQRDAAAPHIGDVLTLSDARTDDPLQNISPPAITPQPPLINPASPQISGLQLLAAKLLAKYQGNNSKTANNLRFNSNQEIRTWIDNRLNTTINPTINPQSCLSCSTNN